MYRKPKIGRRAWLALCLMLALLCSGCMNTTKDADAAAVPSIPEHLAKNKDGIPLIKVYDTADESVKEMDIESYVMGVVAGEMKNSWPMEALKAQAILARTFTMKFLSSKSSGYEGADISTDVKEAQAYNAADVNERVREAVNATRGVVMSADGDYAYAWFHAHSGGKTELPTKALEYKEDPDYLSVVSSEEDEDAPDEVKQWTVEFTLDEVRDACAGAGVKLDSIKTFELGERGESGRTIYFLANGEKVSAPAFRLQIGADKLKSTLIDNVSLEGDVIHISGRGFGHGVGLSQWGAYHMAKNNTDAEKIIEHYFSGIELIELW